jgi:hypothetical protein
MDHETKLRRGFARRPPADSRIRPLASASSRVEEDIICTLAGVELTDACGGGKKVAYAGGVDQRTARRWVAGDPANPINRLRAILDRADDPWRVVSWCAAWATRVALRKEGPLTEERWRELYRECCMVEQPHDGDEDTTNVALLTGNASIADQFHADAKVVSVTLRRLALGFVGISKGWSLNERAH